MSNLLKRRAPIAVGVIAALAATAWASNEAVSRTSPIASNADFAIEERPLGDEPRAIPASESLSANETIVADADAAPVAERGIRQPDITVEQKRLTEDQRIQAQVIDRLAATPRLSGRIGVQSQDAVVTLSGYTMTAGQAWRAARDANRVDGVKYVVNEIRPRVGGSAV